MEGVKGNAQHYPKRNNTRNDPIVDNTYSFLILSEAYCTFVLTTQIQNRKME